MAVVSAANARASLLRKGFRKREGEKHTFYDLYIDGQDVGINTHFSRGKKSHSDIDSGMMHKMIPQLQLTNSRQVLELLDCTMSETEYIQHLRERGRLAPPRPI